MSRENTHSAVPEVHEVMAMPAVAGALQSILGEGYSLHPHTFTHIKSATSSIADGPIRQPPGGARGDTHLSGSI